MLLVPYSSTMAMIDCRIPVRIDATTIAVIMPTTIPRIVKNERNLCARIESRAIKRTSRGNDVDQRIFGTPATCRLASALSQSHYRIESRGLPRRIETCDDADDARHRDGQKYIARRDRHCHSGKNSDQRSYACGERKPENAA